MQPVETSEAVRRLLEMPEPEYVFTGVPWPDYVAACGLTEADVPELLRIVTHPTLLYGDRLPEADGAWLAALTELAVQRRDAPIHAWRALAQLQAPAALPVLVALLTARHPEQDDWFAEDLSKAVVAFGEPAVPLLAAGLDQPREAIEPQLLRSECLAKIGTQHPAARGACVAANVRALARCRRAQAELGGYLVASLVELQAAEAAEAMV